MAGKRCSSFSASSLRKPINAPLEVRCLLHGGQAEVDGSSSPCVVVVVVLLLVSGCADSSSSSSSHARPQVVVPAPGDDEPLEATSATGTWLTPTHESIRTGGSIEGCLPMASCIWENHGHVAAVASPPSVPVPVGGFLSSWKISHKGCVSADKQPLECDTLCMTNNCHKCFIWM